MASVTSTYTAPSMIGNVWPLPELVGFSQIAELLPALQVLEEDELSSVELARPINVLVAKCIASVPWSTKLSRRWCCDFDRCSVMCVGSFILLPTVCSLNHPPPGVWDNNCRRVVAEIDEP